MLQTLLPRWLTIRKARVFAGLVMGLYVTMHLTNHALGLVSVHAQEAARPAFMLFWHSRVGQVLLYGSLTVHGMLGLYALVRRRHYRMPAWEWVQIALGLLVPYLLLVHIVNTRGTRILTRIDIDYVYEIANLWIDPQTRFRQLILVLLVWGHFAVGLHYWLRIRAWYRRAFPAMLLVYFMIPTCGLLGFAETGKGLTVRAAQDPAWYAAIKKQGIPKDPGRAKIRADLKAWVGPTWLGIVGFVFVVARVRDLLNRRKLFGVTYPKDGTVRAPIGMSILEVSRMSGHPHMSICGGRGRCTTCRVRVMDGFQELPPPNRDEAYALARIGAPPDCRLACQTRPAHDVAVQLLLHPKAGTLALRYSGPEFGHEQEVTVLFVDIRGSTKLAENRMPYDVVFVLNHLFHELSEAVEFVGGHYSNFTGDGLMALFGLRRSPDHGARASLLCAAEMLERLDMINARLSNELEAPIQIGVGIHTGLAVVGRMGPPKTPVITALGDTVNTTARLEGLTKELHAPIVASSTTLRSAGVDGAVSLQEVQVRGRSTQLQVAALDAKSVRRLLLGELNRATA